MQEWKSIMQDEEEETHTTATIASPSSTEANADPMSAENSGVERDSSSQQSPTTTEQAEPSTAHEGTQTAAAAAPTLQEASSTPFPMGSVATGVVDSTRPIQEVDTPSRAFDPDTPDLAAPQPSHWVDMSDTQCSQSQSHDAEVTPGSQHDIQGTEEGTQSQEAAAFNESHTNAAAGSSTSIDSGFINQDGTARDQHSNCTRANLTGLFRDTYVFTGEQANLVKELFCQLPDQKTALTHEEAAFLCAALTSGMDGNSSQEVAGTVVTANPSADSTAFQCKIKLLLYLIQCNCIRHIDQQSTGQFIHAAAQHMQKSRSGRPGCAS
ncbi:TPA: hypothetical protein ACH3X3_009685 [Trebouxia sp. C0006]